MLRAYRSHHISYTIEQHLLIPESPVNVDDFQRFQNKLKHALFFYHAFHQKNPRLQRQIARSSQWRGLIRSRGCLVRATGSTSRSSSSRVFGVITKLIEEPSCRCLFFFEQMKFVTTIECDSVISYLSVRFPEDAEGLRNFRSVTGMCAAA